MARVGWILLLVGFAVAVVGTGQFLLVLALKTDPNPNPAVNGVLMWPSWAAGAVLVGVGLALVAGAKVRKWV
jgi:hypothetical protein